MRKRWILSLSLILLVLVLAACSDGDDSKTNEEPAEDSATGDQQDLPEADLEGIPDVVAEVNGEKISKEEFETTYQGQFQQAMMQSQMSGEEVDQDQLKVQIIDGLIGQELLVQKADSSGFETSEEDVDKFLDELVAENGLESTDEFMAALEEQGMKEADVMSQIELQVKVDQLIASELGDLEPTKEEIDEFYDQIVAQQEQMDEDEGEEEVPSFDELKPIIEEQIKGQKEAEAVQALITELRADADITIHL